MSARRDPLRELALLVKMPEAGARNISAHLLEHFDELEHFLPPGCTKAKLSGRTDDELAPELERRLRHHSQAQFGLRQEWARERARKAAAHLAMTASRTAETVTLDVPTLLGDLLLDRGADFVSFGLGDDVRVPVAIGTLVGVRRVLGRRGDLVAFVDSRALHFGWNGGRGGLRLWPQRVVSWATVLMVELPRRAVLATDAAPVLEPANPVPDTEAVPPIVESPPELPFPAAPVRPRARPARRGGSWLHEILFDLGW